MLKTELEKNGKVEIELIITRWNSIKFYHLSSSETEIFVKFERTGREIKFFNNLLCSFVPNLVLNYYTTICFSQPETSEGLPQGSL
jgi:hypothetical protein